MNIIIITAAPHEYDRHLQITVDWVFWSRGARVGFAITVDNNATPVTIHGNNIINMESSILIVTGLSESIFLLVVRSNIHTIPMTTVDKWDTPANMMARLICFMALCYFQPVNSLMELFSIISLLEDFENKSLFDGVSEVVIMHCSYSEIRSSIRALRLWSSSENTSSSKSMGFFPLCCSRYIASDNLKDKTAVRDWPLDANRLASLPDMDQSLIHIWRCRRAI